MCDFEGQLIKLLMNMRLYVDYESEEENEYILWIEEMDLKVNKKPVWI